jgi:hypothetical protein
MLLAGLICAAVHGPARADNCDIALNVGAGLLLGLGYDHWRSGIVSAVVGTTVGEIMIFTQPVDSVADLELYRSGAPFDSSGVGLAARARF